MSLRMLEYRDIYTPEIFKVAFIRLRPFVRMPEVARGIVRWETHKMVYKA